LVVIPPDLYGYTCQQLKAVSGNGKYTLYISPLQEELDTIPLPPEAKEFENMPKAQCTTCKKMVPLQILPVHIKECKTEPKRYVKLLVVISQVFISKNEMLFCIML